MENQRSKRSLRIALVLGAAVAGTALVGFGGLAAWNAYTQNAGNTFAAGTLQHNNQANGATSDCYSTATVTTCSVIVSGSGLSSTWGGTSGTVDITNTGSLNSSFDVLMPAAPTGSLCADLDLGIVDNQTTPATVYGPAALTSALGSTAIADSAGNATWPSYVSGTGPGTAGTNTFTFNVDPVSSGPHTFSTDNNAPGETCSFNVEFDQSA